MKGELLLINNCDQQIHLIYIFIISFIMLFIYCIIHIYIYIVHYYFYVNHYCLMYHKILNIIKMSTDIK